MVLLSLIVLVSLLVTPRPPLNQETFTVGATYTSGTIQPLLKQLRCRYLANFDCDGKYQIE